MEVRPCRSCQSEALNRVRRTLWQRCISKKVYKCHVCGQREYALRSLPLWLRNRLKDSGISLGKVPHLGRHVINTLGASETLPDLKTIGP